MPALLFGSISTVADTSELQRESFNQAFAQHGLDWEWSRDDYVAMLGSNGGQGRVASYAESRGEDVDAAAVHATKSEIFQQRLAETPLTPRAGVAETVAAARDAGWQVGLVTTTSPENVAALASALRPHLDLDSFDVVVDSSKVSASKPDPAAYTWAVEQLGEQPGRCVAVEDNEGGVASASAAGVACVAFPNQNTAGFGFEQAARRVEALDLASLTDLAAA
jgi:HAD superfamily hydrolase (TIGR01509 family)